jgi:hypothetical protein
MEQQKNILDHFRPRRIETPDESFFSNLADQISFEQNVPIKKNYKLKRLVYVSLAAAAIVVFGLWILNDSTKGNGLKNTGSTYFAQVDKSELEKYIEDEMLGSSKDTLTNSQSSKVDILGGKSLQELMSELTVEEIESFFKTEGFYPDHLEDEEEDGLFY